MLYAMPKGRKTVYLFLSSCFKTDFIDILIYSKFNLIGLHFLTFGKLVGTLRK